jgi:hypothetical protein
MIVEDPSRGVIVPELIEYQIDSSDQLRDLVNEGNFRRQMAATGAN